jgi:hypothetical protein
VERPLNWSERILGFPARTAAVADFLRELKAHGSGDLNAVLTTLNDGSLVRETVRYWLGNHWIVIAPNAPLQALAGPEFSRDLTLERFCGATPPEGLGSSDLRGDSEVDKEPADDDHP